MTTKIEQKERTHETILSSASRLLREKGIAGARVADVMKGAGLTVGGFYAHFFSKEDLIDDVLRRACSATRQRLFSQIDAKPEEDRVVVILKRYVSAAHRDDFAMGCPFPAVVGEVATSAPEHAARLSNELGIMMSGLEYSLAPALRHPPPGKKAPLSARSLAVGLTALMVGGLSLARATRGTPLSDEVIKSCRALGAFAVRAAEDA